MTKSLTAALFLITLLILSACKDNVPDSKKLAGTWRLVNEVHKGEEALVEETNPNRLIVDAEGNWRVEADGQTVGAGTLKLDPGANPKTIDYTFTQGEEKGQIFAAIYRLDGDSFTHCGVMGGERPKEFAADAESENYLVTFQRER